VSQPPGASPPAAGLAAVDTVLLADVGNSRIKLAVMTEPATGGTLPLLARRMDLASRSFHPVNLDEWLRAVAPGPAVVLVASVHDVAATRLEAMIAELAATQHRTLRQRRIRPDDLPLQIDLPQPEKVGIDRLAAAAAANRLRSPGRPAVVVDCGTAVTVDSDDDVSNAGQIRINDADDAVGVRVTPGRTGSSRYWRSLNPAPRSVASSRLPPERRIQRMRGPSVSSAMVLSRFCFR